MAFPGAATPGGGGGGGGEGGDTCGMWRCDSIVEALEQEAHLAFVKVNSHSSA